MKNTTHYCKLERFFKLIVRGARGKLVIGNPETSVTTANDTVPDPFLYISDMLSAISENYQTTETANTMYHPVGLPYPIAQLLLSFQE